MNIIMPSNKYLTVIKTTIKNLYNKNVDGNTKNIIEKMVKEVSKVVFHTYNFLTLYFLHLYNKGINFPFIDKDFIRCITRVVSEKGETRGKKRKNNAVHQINLLKVFYNKSYLPLLKASDIPNYDKLTQILEYELTDIVTNVENNIKEHYIQHVNKFVNAVFFVKQKKTDIENNKDLNENQRKEQIKNINDTYYKVKKDILNSLPFDKMELMSDPKFHSWISYIKPWITPNKDEYLKNSLHYDVKAYPQDYLPCLFEINKRLARINKTITHDKLVYPEKKTPYIKLFRVLPLRTSIIPKHTTFDARIVVELFIHGNKSEYFGNIKKKKNEIWSIIFDLKKPTFRKKGYVIHTIKTDGIACSIVFVKLKPNGTPYNPKKLPKDAKQDKTDDMKYIEETIITKEMTDKEIAAIDPNHGNLLSCKKQIKESNHNITAVDANDKSKKLKHTDTVDFRYTRTQRNAETRTKKYNKIRTEMKQEEKIITPIFVSPEIGTRNLIENVQQLESSLSVHNSNLAEALEFRNYLREKIRTNRILYRHYGQPIYRKLQMNTYINTQKSESKMIANFRRLIGPPEKVIIVFGDYDKKDTMAGSEPHISKRLRWLLMINGYEIYKINEYKTSKLCNKCCHENERFCKHEGKLVWGLLRCTNVKCKTIHNRDHNSTRNMIKITESIFAGKGRPIEYTRQPTT